MSLILDALRKSDRSRARQAAERLREGPLPARRSPWPAVMIIAAAVMLLTAALLAWRALTPASSPAVQAGQDVEIMENSPAAAMVRPLRAELARPRVRAISPPAPVELPVAQGAAEPAEPPAGDAHAWNAPPLSALDEAVRARLPRLEMQVHAWAANPAERFVLINLRRYAEGERLDEGPYVRRILPDGVVLEHDGVVFSLPRR